MSIKSYYCIRRVVIAESTSSTRVDFLRDALGNVTALSDSSGSISNRYRYKPYGTQIMTSGSPSSISHLWVGAYGYRYGATMRFANNYVRARHYGSLQGAWTSKDPVRTERLQPYAYTYANPATRRDPSGMLPEPIRPGCHGVCCCCAEGLRIDPKIDCWRDDYVGEVALRLTAYYQTGMHLNVRNIRGDCSLEWHEKATEPAEPDQKPRKWREQLEGVYKYETVASWLRRKRECPGHDRDWFMDTITRGLRNDHNVHLWICIKIRSAPNCPSCSGQVLKATAKVWIRVINGKVIGCRATSPGDGSCPPD